MEKYKFFFEYFMEPGCYKGRIGLTFSLYNAVKNFNYSTYPQFVQTFFKNNFRKPQKLV